MGFLDKVKQTTQETLDKGKEKLGDVQADRSADKLLRDLGAWYYAGRTGRDDGEAPAHVERLVAELQAHEATHGELGKKEEPVVPAAPAAPVAPVGDAPVAPAPPAPPAPPAATDAGAAPPPVDAPAPPPPPVTAAPPPPPVTGGPPPPPPG